MLDYTIVLTASPTELETAVNRMIGSGWIPLGGVAIYLSETHDRDYFAQAMIKHVDKSNDSST